MIQKTVYYPTNTTEIPQLMIDAQKENYKVLIQGEGTQTQLGGIIQSLDVTLSLKKLTKIIDYDIPNLTITVQSGIKLTVIQNELIKNNHFLPLDPIDRTNSTIGGIVATNASGPLRYCYGTCKDLILGMKFILPNGSHAKSGGKTMKDVAGYNLKSIFIGAMGTLGAITEITFRVFPIPMNSRTIEIPFDDLVLVETFLKHILNSNLHFSAIELLNTTAKQSITNNINHSSKYSLIIKMSGEQNFIDLNRDKLAQINPQINFQEIDNFWPNYYSLPFFSSAADNDTVLKITAPISAVASVISLIENSIAHAAVISHAGNGIIYVSFQFEDSNELCSLISKLRRQINGHVTIYNIPAKLKPIIDIWDVPDENINLLKKIKNQFDPYQTIASGRFVGGI